MKLSTDDELHAREQSVLTKLEFEHRSSVFVYIDISVCLIYKINVQVIMMLQVEE